MNGKEAKNEPFRAPRYIEPPLYPNLRERMNIFRHELEWCLQDITILEFLLVRLRRKEDIAGWRIFLCAYGPSERMFSRKLQTHQN
jgi:hypothetical protein